MMQQGQIIEGRGGLYTVRGDADGIEYVLRAKKKFRRQHLTPLVGDRVDYTPGTGDEHGWLEEILPRTSSFIRPPVSNISLLVMVAAETPAPDWLLLDKLLLSAHRQGMRCVLAINKCDLGDTSARTAEADYAQADVTVLRVSAEEKTGLDELLACMHGETVCFAGQSGVGKSTLINALMGLELETGSISRIDIDPFRGFRRESLLNIRLPRLAPQGPGLAFGYEKTGAMTHRIHAACKQTEDGQRYPRYPFMHGLLSDP